MLFNLQLNNFQIYYLPKHLRIKSNTFSLEKTAQSYCEDHLFCCIIAQLKIIFLSMRVLMLNFKK